MSENESGRRKGCFKYGCFGCVGLLVVAGGLVAVVIAIQVAALNNPQNLEDVSLARELPSVERVLEDAVAGAVVTDGGELPVGDSEPSAAALGVVREGGAAPDVPVGRIELDLQVGDFEIRPAEPGTPIRIEGEWDPDDFQLTEELTEEGDGGFTYRVRFAGKGGWLGMLLSGSGNDPDNRLTIYLPRGRPLDIVGDVRIGRSNLQLGGLWLRDVDLEVGTGEHTVEFGEVTPFPARMVNIAGSMGELEVFNLGNASPAESELEFRMGAGIFELDGDWVNDADISVDCGMGECQVEVPDDVHIETSGSMAMGERSIRLPDQENIPEGAPTLRLDIDGSMGEIRVR